MELLVRASVWVSVFCWAVALALRMTGRKPELARLFWTASIAAYGVHLVSAFEVFHRWSHEAAYIETARQTAEMTGIESGFGLWLNYLFGLVWLGDAIFWWGRGHERYLNRSRWIAISMNGFLAFMVFNGTVVFGNGAVRWFGTALFVGLAAVWLRARVRNR